MRVWYNDGGPMESGIAVSSIYAGIISNCINSDSYYKQEYKVTTVLSVYASIYLDDETYISIGIYGNGGLSRENPTADVGESDRDFYGKINIVGDVANPTDRAIYTFE